MGDTIKRFLKVQKYFSIHQTLLTNFLISTSHQNSLRTFAPIATAHICSKDLSLVHMLFIRHACATSCISSARTELKTQQNIELMSFVLALCANIFVGCSVTPTFCGISLPFLILSSILKNEKNLYVGSFNFFLCTIQIGSNWFIDTGVHDLEVAFFKANST